jgi:hypothetical protein
LPRGDHYFDAGWDVASFLARHGYRPTQDADSADIDVWGEWNEVCRRYHVQHYSLRLHGRWTSKLGACGVVVHERGALVSPGHYGLVTGHFVKSAGVVEQVSSPDYTVPYREHRCRACTGGGHGKLIIDPGLDRRCKEVRG